MAFRAQSTMQKNVAFFVETRKQQTTTHTQHTVKLPPPHVTTDTRKKAVY